MALSLKSAVTYSTSPSAIALNPKRGATPAIRTCGERRHLGTSTSQPSQHDPGHRKIADHADAKTHLRQLAAGIHPRLDAASCAVLDMLIEEGCALLDEATVHARAILQVQATLPIMDVFSIDAEGNATEVGSMPLFPGIGREDEEQFFTHMDKLTRWYCDLARFLVEKRAPRKRDHEDEQ